MGFPVKRLKWNSAKFFKTSSSDWSELLKPGYYQGIHYTKIELCRCVNYYYANWWVCDDLKLLNERKLLLQVSESGEIMDKVLLLQLWYNSFPWNISEFSLATEETPKRLLMKQKLFDARGVQFSKLKHKIKHCGMEEFPNSSFEQ